ncbi:hypothetical protein J3R82DRAFT_834 [Butyriboletus roseoflavus]|nr:hypothetical protein J3R82DRAFT_834 [Butyriboletus roseoflavus]
MDHRASPPSDSLEELHRHSPSCSGGSATLLAKKAPPLRIIVPPTEYCPFSTDLTLPITPLSLPTPVSSSCFTFSDMQERVQSVSAPPTPAAVLSSCSRDPAVADFASPTSSQFLLMPPTPCLEDVDIETAIRVSPLATPAATDEPMRRGSGNGTKSENPRPWEVSSSTWLSDLGGHTETDRIFRHNLPDITSVDSESSPASTPALSPSAVSPSSQVSSYLGVQLAHLSGQITSIVTSCDVTAHVYYVPSAFFTSTSGSAAHGYGYFSVDTGQLAGMACECDAWRSSIRRTFFTTLRGCS